MRLHASPLVHPLNKKKIDLSFGGGRRFGWDKIKIKKDDFWPVWILALVFWTQRFPVKAGKQEDYLVVGRKKMIPQLREATTKTPQFTEEEDFQVERKLCSWVKKILQLKGNILLPSHKCKVDPIQTFKMDARHFSNTGRLCRIQLATTMYKMMIFFPYVPTCFIALAFFIFLS